MAVVFFNPTMFVSYLDSTTTEPTTPTSPVEPTTEGESQISVSYSHDIANVVLSCSPCHSSYHIYSFCEAYVVLCLCVSEFLF